MDEPWRVSATVKKQEKANKEKPSTLPPSIIIIIAYTPLYLLCCLLWLIILIGKNLGNLIFDFQERNIICCGLSGSSHTSLFSDYDLIALKKEKTIKRRTMETM
jgi:hypothetical protein